MHPLQREIIYKLIINSDLPYSKLKSPNIEGNLFTYHLKQVLSQELIRKRKDGRYELTNQGKIFADKVSISNLKVRIQPKIVTLIICQNEKQEYLLYKRSRQPFLNLVGFPYGKVHLGEKIKDAAVRELSEKTGLKAELNYRGDIYLLVLQEKEVVSHMLCHVFSSQNPVGQLVKNTEIGECFWEKITDINNPKYMPGFKEVYQLILKNQSGHFFEEFTNQI